MQRKFIDVAMRLPVLDNLEFKPQNSPGEIVLTARHSNNKSNREFSVWCDKFPKLQKELWFVIGYQNEELLMIKRCQPRQQGKEVQLKCDFIIPEELQGNELS